MKDQFIKIQALCLAAVLSMSILAGCRTGETTSSDTLSSEPFVSSAESQTQSQVEEESELQEPNSFNQQTPIEMAQAMQPGWNLGNSLDAIPTETSWNNELVEKSTIDGILADGFRSIRIPVTWTHHVGEGPDYIIDSIWLDRVEQVVDWVIDQGAYAVLNMYHDSWEWVANMTEQPEETTQKFVKIWSQIAERFKDKSQFLLFEALNEPPTTLTDDQLNTLNREFVETVRATGGGNTERCLILSGSGNDPEKTMEGLVLPEDDRLMVTFHYYSPWDFVSNWWGKTSWGTEEDKNVVQDLFVRLHDTYVAKGIPVLLTEFACNAYVYEPAQLYWYDYITETAQANQISVMLWDNGTIYNRSAKEWNYPRIAEIILQAAGSQENSFVIPGAIYLNPSEQLEDKKVNMELRGNTLQGIYEGERALTLGQDYLLDGNVVTLKREYLESVQKTEYGLSATLDFRFSEGADYHLDIFQINQPTVGHTEYTLSAQGEKFDLTVSVEFYGASLQTVSAVEVESGANASTQDSWTPYLRYDEDFYVTDSGIVLTKHFLEMLDEDTKCTFHFWGTAPVEIMIRIAEPAETSQE